MTSPRTPSESLALFITLTREGSLDPTYNPHWKGLLFTPEGAARVMNMAGYIAALVPCGHSRLAEVLATDLDKTLTYLADYGGVEDLDNVDADGKTCGLLPNVRRFVVQVGGGRSFGELTIGWSYRITPRERYEARVADKADPVDAADVLQLPSGYKHYVHAYIEGEGPRPYVTIYYRRRFTGGAILRDMPNDIPAWDGLISPNWSIHT